MDYVKEGFAKIDRDLEFLITCFREVEKALPFPSYLIRKKTLLSA
jgi:hypothetical protein